MKKTLAFVCLLVAVLAMTAPAALGQATSTNYRYGLSGWAINNQRVASQFNYDIDATFQNGLATFTYPQATCQQALAFGGNNNKDPFNTNASVKIVDNVSETVALSSKTYSGGNCTLSLATSNAHTSFHLRSGTCGLREALNDMGGQGGEVIVDQKFYDDGCTAATITGLAQSGLQANQIVYDISNAQNTFYTVQPSTLTALATPATRSATAGATQVISGTAVGTWAASAYFVCVTYVDMLGGESPCSGSFSFTATASVALNYASPAASSGAVGWRAYAGLTGTSTQYQLPITASNCTLSTSTPYPTCAIGAAGVFPTPTTATALAPGYVVNVYRPNTQSHTTFAYAPVALPPSRGAGFQSHYGPFITTGNIPAGNIAVLGTVPLGSAVLNSIYTTVRITGRIADTAVSTATQTIAVALGPSFTTGTPTSICTMATTTAMASAAYGTVFSCTMTTNAVGASGTLMPDGWALTQLQAGTTTGLSVMVDTATAAITNDITQQDSIFVVLTSATAATNPAQLLDLHIEYLN